MCVYIFTYIHTWIYVYAYTHIYIFIQYIYIHIYVHACTYVHIYIYMYIYICTYIHIYIYIYMYIYTYVHIYIYVHMYIHIYIYSILLVIEIGIPTFLATIKRWVGPIHSTPPISPCHELVFYMSPTQQVFSELSKRQSSSLLWRRSPTLIKQWISATQSTKRIRGTQCHELNESPTPHTHTHRANKSRANISPIIAHYDSMTTHWLPLTQHTATQCNTLQHTATHCNTLQHSATHTYRGAVAGGHEQVARYVGPIIARHDLEKMAVKKIKNKFSRTSAWISNHRPSWLGNYGRDKNANEIK